jgi:hypothetical protein
MNGWLRDLNGHDVYTEDGEWWWYPSIQQWVHDPALLAMPSAPMGVTLRNEAERLTTGWPTLRSALWPTAHERCTGFWRNVWVWGLRGYLLFFVLWFAFHAKGFALATWDIVAMEKYTVPASYSAYAANCFGFTLLYGLVAFWALVLVYRSRCWDVDWHKAAAIDVGILAYTGYKAMKRHHRAHDAMLRSLGHDG